MKYIPIANFLITGQIMWHSSVFWRMVCRSLIYISSWCLFCRLSKQTNKITCYYSRSMFDHYVVHRLIGSLLNREFLLGEHLYVVAKLLFIDCCNNLFLSSHIVLGFYFLIFFSFFINQIFVIVNFFPSLFHCIVILWVTDL